MHGKTRKVIKFQIQNTLTRREQKEKLEEGKDPSVVIAKNIGDTREKCCEVKWYPLNWKKSGQEKKDNAGSWNEKSGPKLSYMDIDGSLIPRLLKQQCDKLM